MRAPIVLPVLLAACAAPSATANAPDPEPLPPPPEITAELVSTDTATAEIGQVGRGELPWWHDLAAGVYRFEGQTVVLAVGDSKDHHHIAEGFITSKVRARLAARKATERIGFAGPMPEPEMYDLFITREQRFLALYRLVVPADAALSGAPVPLAVPPALRIAGLHRRGRHVFEGDRHLFLECDVEGPIANPDWGRSRASARY